MNRNNPLTWGVFVTAVLLAGCAPADDEDPEQNEEPLPAETAEAFADFSDVELPEAPEELEISVERNQYEESRYRIHMTGTEDDVDAVCSQVGNYLPHVDEERIEAEAEELDVPDDATEAVDMDNIYGCSAVIQSSGIDVNALVLKPDEDGGGTATMYLKAEPFESRPR